MTTETLNHEVIRSTSPQEYITGVLQPEIHDKYLPRVHAAENLQRTSMLLLEGDDPENVRVVNEVVGHNMLDGTEITPVLGKNSAGDVRRKQTRLLEIYEKDPDAARQLVHNNVAGFHGSTSSSLWGVLEHDALLSAKEARRRGQIIASGERTFSQQGGQATVSFADWRAPESIALYADTEGPLTINVLHARLSQAQDAHKENLDAFGSEHPLTYNAEHLIRDLTDQISFIKDDSKSEHAKLMLEEFPVAYGLDFSNFHLVDSPFQLPKGDLPDNTIIRCVRSDIKGEFMVTDGAIPLSKIPVVAVPETYINYVKSLFERRGKHVSVIDLSLLTERTRQ